MVLFQHSLWVETFLQKIAKTLEVAVYYVSSMLESVKDSNFMLGMQALAQIWLLTDKSWIQSIEFISLIKIIQGTDKKFGIF